MLDEDEQRGRSEQDASIKPLQEAPQPESGLKICAKAAGFIQQFDLEALSTLARKNRMQIVLHRSPGDFIVAGEVIMSAHPATTVEASITEKMRNCYTQGANRTDAQDVLFLSDQLVEVLGRALSTGVNDPHSAMLCLNWLRAGLVAFAQRSADAPARKSDPVLYRRVTFENMLNKSFDEMR
ncbi:MAG: DUF2254 family protein [Paracoccaceae bacterium]